MTGPTLILGSPSAPTDLNQVRSQFSALQQKLDGRDVAFLDGAAGSQVPQRVIDAMAAFWKRGNSNTHGLFEVSRRVEAEQEEARGAVAEFLNARCKEEVAFGQNMTSVTFSLSRALTNTWKRGDEILLSRLDHDANISPWLLAAREKGVKVKWIDARTEDCTLDLDSLDSLLTKRTRLVAATWASNAVGSVTDMRCVTKEAHRVGALVFADAVHYAPHFLIDVRAAGIDLLACSAYKFFGPHTGIMWGRHDLLESLTAYKVRPASSSSPSKWETGTQSFESICGVKEAVDYIADIGREYGGATGAKRREALAAAYAVIGEHERALSNRFIEGAERISGLTIHGITDTRRLAERAPTFAVSLQGRTAAQVSEALGREGIFTWAGHYYALEIMEKLKVLKRGGLTRISFLHYNTEQECDRALEALSRIARR